MGIPTIIRTILLRRMLNSEISYLVEKFTMMEFTMVIAWMNRKMSNSSRKHTEAVLLLHLRKA